MGLLDLLFGIFRGPKGGKNDRLKGRRVPEPGQAFTTEKPADEPAETRRLEPRLPQDETDPESIAARAEHLALQKTKYVYDYDYLPDSTLAMLKNVPAEEQFTSRYIAERIVATLPVLSNAAATKVRQTFDPLDELDDFKDYFNTRPLPELAKNDKYLTDDHFAQQRLSGINPLMIKVLPAADARTGVLSAMALDFDLAAEQAAGRVFVTDYTGTDPSYRGPSFVKGGVAAGQKHLPKPLAFFRWTTTASKLVPIAIVLDASADPAVYTPKSPPGRVFTPKEANPNDWLFAKICVQIADVVHHEISSHLGRTHFVLEPIGISTARHLDYSHPLSILLRVHLRFVLTNNNLGQLLLLNKNGAIDRLLPGTLPESFEILKEVLRTWNIKEFMFPQELKNRGVDDPNKLPSYPFRDDGMLHWNTIQAYVTAYLKNFYPSDAKIAADAELQNWAKELSDMSAGGKVAGFPVRFQTVQELIEIVTTVIFTSSSLHSALNYSQYEYAAFVPNMPLSGYGPIDVPTAPVSTSDILKLLPADGQTASQLQTIDTLTAYRFDKLGDYSKSFDDLYATDVAGLFGRSSAVNSILAKFQADLKEVEKTIDGRNAKRAVPYIFLKPSLVLNSTSI